MGKVMRFGTNKYPKLLLFMLRAHNLEMMGKETDLDIQLNHKMAVSC